MVKVILTTLLILLPTSLYAQAVVWTNIVNMTVEGNTITANGTGTDYDAYATSQQSLTANGYFQFTAPPQEFADAIYVGLSNTTGFFGPGGFDHAIYFLANGSAGAYETGATFLAGVSFTPGDIFKIVVNGSTVTFQKNGTTFATSTVAAGLPKKLRVTALTVGASISNASLSLDAAAPPPPPPVLGTNIKVCASGCDFTNAQLQNAMDGAAAGSTIWLQEGFEYVPSNRYTLNAKACGAANDTCYVTVRTGVTSTGTYLPESDFPAENVRITPSYAPKLAKLKVASNNVGVIETLENTKVKYWKFKRVQFLPNAYGGDTIIRLGWGDNTGTANYSQMPENFILDQIYVKGDTYKGQFRGISIHTINTQLINSYIEDIKATGEGQAIWCEGVNGLIVRNNTISGGTEAFLCGGSGGIKQSATTSANTTTSSTLSNTTDLHVGQGLTFIVSGVERFTTIVSCGTSVVGAVCSSNNVTFTALASAPTGNASWSSVNKNLTIEKNLITRPASWRTTPIIPPPSSINAVGLTTGGTLTAGTYFYRIVSRLLTSQAVATRSTASNEVSATIASGSTGSITLSWQAVPGAEEYYIYGRSSGGQNIRFSVSAPTVTFTDTGGAGTSESVPVTTGNFWQVKNTFELKNADTATIQGNVIENSWVAGQGGPLVLFTGTTQGSEGDSAVVKNITFINNLVRNGAQAIQITGRDAQGSASDRQRSINISNNVFHDLDSSIYGYNNAIIITGGGDSTQVADGCPAQLTIDHNIFHGINHKSGWMIDCYRGSTYQTMPGFTATNNIFYKGDYGLAGIGASGTQQGLISPFLGSGSVVNKNIVTDASCTLYLTGTECPTQDTLESGFTNLALRDFTLKVSSPYKGTALGNTDYGPNHALITPLTTIAISGNNTGAVVTPTTPDPLIITTTVLPSGQKDTIYGQTLASTGGTGSKVWSLISGDLPTGLALTSGGVIAGTPTVAGLRTFTVRVTDSAVPAVITQKEFSLNIAEKPVTGGGGTGNPGTMEPRPVKINGQEGRHFKRSTGEAPTVAADQVEVGDLWTNLSTNTLNVSIATSPTLVWQAIGTGGGSISPMNIAFFSAVSLADTVNTPAAENEFASARIRQRVNWTGYTQCASYTRVIGVAGGSTTMRIQYSADNGSTWFDSGVTVVVSSTGEKFGAYQNLVAGAIGDLRLLRMVTQNGDALSALTLSSLNLTCK